LAVQHVYLFTQIYAKTLGAIAQFFATWVVYTRRIAEIAELANAIIRKTISRGLMKTRKCGQTQWLCAARAVFALPTNKLTGEVAS
jgi:hypothetical protein